MRKSILFLVVAMLTVILSGCILSKTPNTNEVAIEFNEQMAFSVNVFPPGGTYTWTLDEVPLSNTEKSYLYTAHGGNHILVVKAKHLFGSDTQTWNITTPSPPVANSGSDQTVAFNATVTLDGSGSTDPDNDIVSYQWVQTDGPSVTLINSDTAIATFTANVAYGSSLIFELVVTDAGSLHAADTCVVTISNMPDPISILLNSMVTISGGTFDMGSTDDEHGWAQFTTPVHTVTLQGFEIGAYEVTQAQYLAVMGTNPSFFQGSSYPGSENNPVEQVHWYDARAFCTALSAMTGRTFTLPSEAQWEYACRAGTTTLYSYGDSDALLDNYAWYYSNSGLQTHPVGTKLPNNWGLYDMMGNVWEWCMDSWHDNYVDAPTDGSVWGPDDGSGRYVLRDGGFYTVGWSCRSAIRYYNYSYGSSHVGFRIVAIP
jgi:formylglycine-generating enzyme required for sulfatase activity